MRARVAGALVAALVAAPVAGCGAGDDVPSPVGPLDGGVDEAGVEATDPLSMPASPTLTSADFASATSCKGCHPRHFEEWSGSRHAAAVSDAVFEVLVMARQKARQGKQDRFCTQCHSIVGVRSGEIAPGFSFGAVTGVAAEGVTCETCHAATSVERTHNAGLALAASGAVHGNLEAPAATPAHTHAAGPFLRGSEFCAACHDVRELVGLSLERPYEEWLASPAGAAGQTCQDCHMPRYDGQAAVGGAARTGLHTHRFVGLDPPGAADGSTNPRKAEFEADLAGMLAGAATLRLGHGDAAPGKTLDVTVTIANRVAGHSLPTGTTFVRQCWVELVATDADGRVVYETGTLDANQDLRDRYSEISPYGDADLVSLSSQLFDASGTPTLFPWLAVEHRRNALRAGETKTWTYFVPLPADAKGRVSLRARLRIRTYPPFLFRLLGADALVPTIRTFDLASDALEVDL